MSPMPADMPPTLSSTTLGVHHATGAGPASTARTRTYTVRPGDTVYGIATRHNTTVRALVRANALSDGGRWIRPGQRLRMSGASHSPTTSTSSSSTSQRATSSGHTVTVRPGDTMSGIAAKHGISVSALARVNGISNTRLIYPGQKLVVGGSPPTSSPRSSAPTHSSASAPRTSASHRSVRVQAGDTLYRIATTHGLSLNAVIEANPGIRPRALQVGAVLRLPASAETSGDDTSEPSPSQPYTQDTIGDSYSDREVDRTFLHYTYSSKVARSAAANRDYLASVPAPSHSQTRAMIVTTARRHGIDPSLMLALALKESSWNQRAVSPANAIGIMQVIPTSGDWASSLVGRRLNLFDPQDNVTAGVVIVRALLRSADTEDHAIGGYYQGLGSVQREGMFPDTRSYVKKVKTLRSQM
ncbi:MAG: LysM peptidoglycan-binding domain-containing protein [Ornithinimicrobium sp.]